MNPINLLPCRRWFSRLPRLRQVPRARRPSIEPLEDRLTPAAISWTGAAGDDLWATPTNWSLNRVPSNGDDVRLDVPGTPTIVYSGGNTTVGSILSKESLRITGGRLSASRTFEIRNADLFFSGGSLGQSVSLTDVALHLETASAATFLFLGGQNTLTGNISSAHRLIVRGDETEGDAKVGVLGALQNAGQIQLEGDGFASATLEVLTAPLTNVPGGQIQFSGGLCVLDADVRNDGFISVQSDAQMGSGGNGTKNRNTGFIQVLNGALLDWDAAGPVNERSGIISGVGRMVVLDSPPDNRGIIDLVDANDPADPEAPTVVDTRKQPSALTVTFFSPAGMKKATLKDPASYVVRTSGGDGQFGQGNEGTLTPSQVSYDAPTGRVILQFAHPLPRDTVQLKIVSSAIKDKMEHALLPPDALLDYVFVFPSPGQPRVQFDMQAASDTGASSTDNLTRDRTPTFDVTVDAAGTIKMDWNGDGVIDQKLRVTSAGTYTLQAPQLTGGARTVWTRFQPSAGAAEEAALDILIDRKGPRLLSNNTGTTQPFSSIDVHFSEVIDASTFTLEDVVLKRPDGTIVPVTEVTGSGADYTIHFSDESAGGQYRLHVGPDVGDLAGNRMDQDRDGVRGEPGQDAGIQDVRVNHAPLLDTTYILSLSPIRNTGGPVVGVLVRDLLNPQGVDLVTDPDAGALEGIAVTSVDDTNGAWQYSLDRGFTWKAFGAVNASSPRLLAADTKSVIRFVPHANFVGTATDGLIFRAWDQSIGVTGGVLDVLAAEAAATFSLESEGISVEVTA